MKGAQTPGVVIAGHHGSFQSEMQVLKARVQKELFSEIRSVARWEMRPPDLGRDGGSKGIEGKNHHRGGA